MCVCVCVYLYVCVCVRGREIDKREKDKEKKRRKEGREKKQRTWKKFRVSCLSSNQMQNGKENHRISKLNKEQLTRYIQALSKTVTHTTHHTHFFPSSNTLLLLYPSISCPVFLSAVGKCERARMCTTAPRPQGGSGELEKARALTPPEWEQLVLQDILRVRPVVHQVQLGDHADGPRSCCESRYREQHQHKHAKTK